MRALRRALRGAATLVALAVVAPADAALADDWYQVDPHVHSVVSGDAQTDLGVISQAAKARGYNAMFITDHQAGSNFPIGGVVANNVLFEDDLGTKWDTGRFGSLSSTVMPALASSPVRSGTKSLRVVATSATSGERYVVLERGPKLRSGNLTLRFSVYPTQIPADSGLYVSASIGGDATVDTPVEGYTTSAGVASQGKSTVLVWQLGRREGQRRWVGKWGFRPPSGI